MAPAPDLYWYLTVTGRVKGGKTCVKSEKPRANEEESRSLFLYILCTIGRRGSSVEAGRNLLDDHATVAVRYFCSCTLQ